MKVSTKILTHFEDEGKLIAAATGCLDGNS